MPHDWRGLRRTGLLMFFLTVGKANLDAVDAALRPVPESTAKGEAFKLGS